MADLNRQVPVSVSSYNFHTSVIGMPGPPGFCLPGTYGAPSNPNYAAHQAQGSRVTREKPPDFIDLSEPLPHLNRAHPGQCSHGGEPSNIVNLLPDSPENNLCLIHI